DPLDSLMVEGTEVAAVAGATLLRLVRNDQAGEVTASFSPDAGLHLPITAGDRVGRVVVRVAGRLAGVVPAVAAATAAEPSPAPPGQPRLLTPLDLGLRALRAVIQAVLGPFL